MGYEAALKNAWEDIAGFASGQTLRLRFLSDEYAVELSSRRVWSVSCNVPAKDHLAIVILHYLAQRQKGLPDPVGEWISFKELAGGEVYYPAFRRRAIEPLIRKYGPNPQGILGLLERVPGRLERQADASVAVEVCEAVWVLIQLWKADEDFGAEGNILFDKNTPGIFCTEDIAVLGGLVAGWA